MIKVFFYWLFQKSKTLRSILNLNIQNVSRMENRINEHKNKALIDRIKTVLEINQNRSLRRKWKRITENKNSPFYIYK
jgi:hypothetical protein